MHNLVGRKLKNRYLIVEHLGDGSTATVYKAVDTRLGRDVALKVLLPHVRDTTRKRFFQEATAAARLNHPNIMAIYDIDDDGDTHFLVIEYVEGDTLTSLIPSPVETVVRIGRQIALALNYAHEREVIHRDIKPANIKVTTDGTVKLMDLGLALPKEAKRVTAEGMIIGTPAYLSPEQAQGHTLDHRTDLYSLGIVLYEMATGQLPFSSDDIPALLLQQVKQPPPPLRLHLPTIPIALDTVVLKALEKNPARRFQTGLAMAEALGAVFQATNTPSTQTSEFPDVGESSVLADADAVTRPSRPLRVILADDHTLVRQSLVAFLSEQDGFLIVGQAADGERALQQTMEHRPDILVLDLNMPGKSGLEVLPRIRALAPDVKVLVLSGRDEDWYIMQALRSGAHGYILKTSADKDLVEGLHKVARGMMVLGDGVAQKVVGGVLRADSIIPDKMLTEMERQLLLHIAAGFDEDQVAERLHLNPDTQHTLVASVMLKMDAKDRHAAALQALRRGLILIDEVLQLGV
ncbi:MAG: protein kinase [Anaerolineae bacterium]|nr:protein kinase [Anaerolineae bacterium]